MGGPSGDGDADYGEDEVIEGTPRDIKIRGEDGLTRLALKWKCKRFSSGRPMCSARREMYSKIPNHSLVLGQSLTPLLHALEHRDTPEAFAIALSIRLSGMSRIWTAIVGCGAGGAKGGHSGKRNGIGGNYE